MDNGRKLKEREVDRSTCTYAFKKEQVMITDDAWGYCVIALLFGKFPGMKAFNEMRESWKVPNQYMFHETGYTLFKFENEEDRSLVLRNGPYSTFGAPWMMKEMPHFFQFDDDCFSHIPVWVKFPFLPLECYGEEPLSIVASFVGKPITTDQFTRDMNKPSYARVLVEVDATKPLVRELFLEMPNGKKVTQPVLYEMEPKACLKCRTLGHDKEECQGKVLLHRGRSKSRAAKRRKNSVSRPKATTTAVIIGVVTAVNSPVQKIDERPKGN